MNLINPETEYEIDRSLSYTRLVDFAKNGPSALINRSVSSTYAMSLGSLTDDFLNDDVDISSKYQIFDGAKPTASLGKLCNAIIDYYREVPSKEEVLNIVKNNGFWSNVVKEDLLLSKFDLPEFWDYITVMIEKGEKEIITSEMYVQAQELATTIKTHDFTKHFFENECQKVYQFPFEISIKNIVFRGVVDYILIDHNLKTVSLIDFKTGSEPAENFASVFLNMRYFIQEAVYMKAFKEICKVFKLKGYNLLPFQFIYICKSQMIPVSYKVSKSWHKAAIEGFTTSTGYTYRGLNELIEEVIWHFNNRVFNMSKILYESNGKFDLNDDFIKFNNG